MRRPILITLVALLLPIAPIRALDPADHLAGLSSAIGTRDAALTGDLDKARKKTKKAYGACLGALAGEPEDLASAAKVAGKVAGKLKKLFPTDAGLADAMDAALDSMEAELAGVVADFQAEIDTIPETDAKGKAKAQKALDKMQSGLDAATASTDFRKRAKLLVKTAKTGKKVRKAIDKADSGGGGGGDECPGEALEAGETFHCLVDGVAFAASRKQVETLTQGTVVRRVEIWAYQCGAGKEARILLQFPGIPEVKSYDFGPASAGACYGVTFTGFCLGSTSGNVTVTSFDPGTGRVQGTFAFVSTPPPGEGAATITGGVFDVVLGAL